MTEQQLTPTPDGGRAVSPGERARRRRKTIAIGTACGLVGVLVGMAAGAEDPPPAETVTHLSTVTKVKTERVPVVRVRTVTKIRRVVRTETVEAPAAVPVEAAAAPSSSGASDYAGMTCSEIGHSFEVVPGSDPEHDADNDGVACESY